MSEPVTFPAPVLDFPPPPRNKWEREYRAFLQMLPELLKTHRGKYVAVHDGRVVGVDDDKIELALTGVRQDRLCPRLRRPSRREAAPS